MGGEMKTLTDLHIQSRKQRQEGVEDQKVFE